MAQNELRGQSERRGTALLKTTLKHIERGAHQTTLARQTELARHTSPPPFVRERAAPRVLLQQCVCRLFASNSAGCERFALKDRLKTLYSLAHRRNYLLNRAVRESCAFAGRLRLWL